MSWHVRVAVSGLVWFHLMGCSSGTPAFTFSASPSSIDDQGAVTTLRIVATDGSGSIGKGKLKVRSSAGSLTEAVILDLDAFGTASSPFSCAVAADAQCKDSVRIAVEWTNGSTAVLSDSFTVKVGGGTTGSGGGTGGGSGGASGSGEVYPSDVYVFAEVQGTCNGRVLADTKSLATVDPGFPYMALPPVITPNGQVYYALDDGSLWQWARDSITKGTYPLNPESNDTKITPPVPLHCTPVSILFAPDSSEFYYACMGVNAYTRASTGENVGLLFAAGGNGQLFGFGSTSYVVLHPDGTSSPISFSSQSTANLLTARSTSGGFWYTAVSKGGTCERWKLAFDGSTTHEGDYQASVAPHEGSSGCSQHGRIDANGDSWLFVGNKLFHHPLGAPAEFVADLDVFRPSCGQTGYPNGGILITGP